MDHSHSHDHSACNEDTSHSHNVDLNLPKTNKKSKYYILVAYLANLIVIAGSLIKIYILKDFIEGTNEKIAYNYISWVGLIMMLLTYFKAFINHSSQTNIEGLVDKEPRRLFSIPLITENKCKLCNKLKLERSSHCSTCNTCISRRDHHCPWMNKCIGLNNTQFFINYLFWVWLSGVFYIYGYMSYYNNSYNDDKNNIKLTWYLAFFFNLYTIFIGFFGTLGIAFLLITQLNSIFNETTYMEREKNAHLESYNLLCRVKNYDKKALGYNKGFSANFYNIVGPTLFHLIFPLDKYSKNDFPESNNAYGKIKHPHPIEVRRFLIQTQPSLLNEMIEKEKKDGDPNNFLEIAKYKYKNALIL